MGLFSKKLSLEEILKGIADLSEEEKAELKAKLGESDKVEEEVKTENKVEENQTETTDNVDAKTEEIVKESNEVDENTGNVENIATENIDKKDAVAEDIVGDNPNVNEETTQEDKAEENSAEIIQGLTDRISALEEKLSEFEALKEKMDDYVKKNDEAFGYKGETDADEDENEYMSADKLKSKILNN